MTGQLSHKDVANIRFCPAFSGGTELNYENFQPTLPLFEPETYPEASEIRSTTANQSTQVKRMWILCSGRWKKCFNMQEPFVTSIYHTSSSKQMIMHTYCHTFNIVC
jgi:hypothetical protein